MQWSQIFKMNHLEKFDYRNFGKFINEIVSNPDIVKKRDFLAEKAYEWFEVSKNDIAFVDKDQVIKDLYKYMCMTFYIVFKDNPEATKIDILNIKTIEKNFPNEVYYLNKNVDNWQYTLTYYSGIIDALSNVLKMRDGQPFKKLVDDITNGPDEKDEE